MVDAVLTSRRNFLKLTAASALAIPAYQIERAAQIILPSALPRIPPLPPNMLHIREGEQWRAVGYLHSVHPWGCELDPHRVDSPSLSAMSRGAPQELGDSAGIEARMPFPAALMGVLDEVLWAGRRRSFAISTGATCCEFTGHLLSYTAGIYEVCELTVRLGVDLEGAEVRALEF